MNKPDKPVRRDGKSQRLDDLILNALEHMLEAGETISYRSVVRAVDRISATSSITRDSYRRSLVEYYQAIQNERRQWIKRAQKQSQRMMAEQLAARDHRIQELEHQLAILTASHKAMILAIGETGGMSAWHQFFDNYEQIKREIN